MKLRATLLLCLCTPLFSIAQFNYEWNLHNNGNGENYGRAVCTDINGDIITMGTFTDTISFDGAATLISNGNVDTYVQKVDAGGTLIWAVSFGDAFNDVGRGLTTDGQGNIYIVGNYKGVVDFDPGAGVASLTSNGQTDGFVLKLDASGNYQWAHVIGGTTYERAFAVATDNNNDVYITGYFGDTVDFDPGPSVVNEVANSSIDAFVLKLQSDGSFSWVQAYGGGGNDIALAVDLNSSNECIVGGYFSDTVDFDPGPGITSFISGGDTDMYVQLFDASGTHMWTKVAGDSLDQSVRYIHCDDNDNIYLTGSFMDTVDFDLDAGTDIQPSKGETDFFVQKLNSTGVYQWTKTFGGSWDDRARAIDSDPLGNIYITGDFADTVDFDPSASTYALYADTVSNIFTLQLTSNGDLMHVENTGSTSAEGGYGIAVDDNANVYVTGFFEDTVDFDNSAAVDEYYALNDNPDACVFKFSQCLQGITSPDTSVTNNGHWLEANQAGAIYQWLDCDNGMSSVGGETMQQVYPTWNGAFAVEVTLNGCTDTSGCHSVEVWGLEELNVSSSISLFPNPTTDDVTLDFGEQKSGIATLSSITGKQLGRIQFTNTSEVDLELSDTSGCYFIRLQFEDGSIAMKKVIKE